MDKSQVIKNVTVSATALRRMATALQKARKTKNNVITEIYVTTWKEKNKEKRTIGIKL